MAPKGCAVRGSGARLTPETLALCGSGYSLASSLQTTLTRTHTFSLFLNTPLVPPASRAWLPLLFGASTQDDWVFLCSISDGYKLTACSYALVLVHSLKLPAIILVSDRLTNLPIHPLIHSSSQPQSRRVTHPHSLSIQMLSKERPRRKAVLMRHLPLPGNHIHRRRAALASSGSLMRLEIEFTSVMQGY